VSKIGILSFNIDENCFVLLVQFRPGRQIVTFLLVANISMWFINTLIKGHASFRYDKNNM
jgi:hypothetical protein